MRSNFLPISQFCFSTLFFLYTIDSYIRLCLQVSLYTVCLMIVEPVFSRTNSLNPKYARLLKRFQADKRSRNSYQESNSTLKLFVKKKLNTSLPDIYKILKTRLITIMQLQMVEDRFQSTSDISHKAGLILFVCDFTYNLKFSVVHSTCDLLY